MATVQLTTGNDTKTINQSTSATIWGNTYDGLAGTDILSISETYSGFGSFLALTVDTAGVVSITNASGTAKFVNFEQIKFTDLTITLGTSGNDTVTGGSAADYFLYGLAGDDTINGGAGADAMFGGAGNDTYIVDNAGDLVTELTGDGTDTINASITFSLADTDGNGTLTATSRKGGSVVVTPGTNGGNVENLTLTGAAAINGTGDGLNNALTGNAGNNLLKGAGGDDTLTGGGGSDTALMTGAKAQYTVTQINATTYQITDNTAGRDGVDTLVNIGNVQFSDGTFAVSSLIVPQQSIINGDAGNNTLTGTSADDIINGLGGNDTLDGAGGADTLVGGTGDDTYVVDTTTDTITELNGEGTDTVKSSVTIASLASNVENLTLTGSAAINGTGNALNNLLTGNSGNNTLTGSGGTDTAVMTGSKAQYLVMQVNATTYQITDTTLGRDGTDTLVNITNVQFSDGTFAVSSLIAPQQSIINGDAGNNTLAGTSANDTINGLGGNDTMDGAGGIDTLVGGVGDDIYTVDTSTDIIVELPGEGNDTVRSSVTQGILAANVENLLLTGSAAIDGTGNSLNNSLTGNSASNLLTGGGGDDTLTGGGGTDTAVMAGAKAQYTVVQVNATTYQITDTTVLRDGTDTLVDIANVHFSDGTFSLSSLVPPPANVVNGDAGDNSLTGTFGADTLYGFGGNDTIDGGGGIDTLVGGAGDDTFIVDTATDIITELAGEGTDTVRSSVSQSSLAANVENLVLTGTSAINGTGNNLNNALTGNSADNALTGGGGDDTLTGGGGSDTAVMTGAKSQYTVTQINSTTYQITDNTVSRDGIDTLVNITNIQFSDGTFAASSLIAVAPPASINGDSGNNKLVGTAGNDTINGLAGNDVLNGTGGVDTLAGGSGNDTYIVDTKTDIIKENANSGIDTVKSAVSQTALAANVENLLLTGSGAINGTGNGWANVLTGNASANVLSGQAGNDKIYGMNGADKLYGGANNDLLTGGLGKDILSGGLGRDVFDFNTLSESSKTLAKSDIISDFTIGQDRIDLSTIDASVFAASNNAFKYIGAHTFYGHAGELRSVVANSTTYVTGDVNGDRMADFAIALTGMKLLHAADFVL